MQDRNRHHGQHQGIVYGRLEHVDDTSWEIVGYDERRHGSLSWRDYFSGSTGQRRCFHLVSGGTIVLNYVFCGSVKCTAKRGRLFVIVTSGKGITLMPSNLPTDHEDCSPIAPAWRGTRGQSMRLRLHQAMTESRIRKRGCHPPPCGNTRAFGWVGPARLTADGEWGEQEPGGKCGH